MPPAMLNLGGRKFVVIPEGEYRQLKAKAARPSKPASSKRRATAQERGDVAESKRRLAEPGRRLTAQEVFRKLGV